MKLCWHGNIKQKEIDGMEKPDVSAMEQAYEEMKKIREYTEKPMPVNRDEFFHYLWAREALRKSLNPVDTCLLSAEHGHITV